MRSVAFATVSCAVIALGLAGTGLAQPIANDDHYQRHWYSGAQGLNGAADSVVNQYTPYHQREADVDVLTNGDAVVVWTDLVWYDGSVDPRELIRYRIFHDDGTAATGEMTANTSQDGYQWWPGVAHLTGGGFVIVWQDETSRNDDPGDAVRGQVFSSTGAPLGPEFLVNTTVAEDQFHPSVTTLPGDQFVVAWADGDQHNFGTNNSIRAQRFWFDSNTQVAQKQGPELTVNTTNPGVVTAPTFWLDAFSLADGGYVVVWNGAHSVGADVDKSSVRAQRYLPSFNADPAGEFVVNSTTVGDQTFPAGTALGDGFIITWSDDSHSSDDPSGQAIRAQIYDKNANPIGAEFRVNDGTYNNQEFSSVASTVDGGAVVVFHDGRLGNQSIPSTSYYYVDEIRGRYIDPMGTPVGQDFLVNTNLVEDQREPAIAALHNGAIVATWMSAEPSTQLWGNFDIRMRMIEGICHAADETHTKHVLANDHGVEPLTITEVNSMIVGDPGSITLPSGATVIHTGGVLVYNPASAPAMAALQQGQTATETFTYTVVDANGDTDNAQVSIEICGVQSSGKGMTWKLNSTDPVTGVVDVGCASGASACDPYNGDMACSASLPLLCFRNLNTPKPSIVNEPNKYHRWSKGVVHTSAPIQASTIPKVADGDAICAAQFGQGWRVAEFHDGWGWNFIAFGNVGDPNSRFWVDINDQPNGTCWQH